METLFSQLSELGYKTSIVPLRHVHDLEKEITDFHARGLFDKEFYKQRLAWLRFNPPENLLRRAPNPGKYRVAQVLLPKKLLAVRSGLGFYGRNNLCYVEGMGSFHQLAAFYTEVPCSESRWQESRLMERCKDCWACLRNCPTGAISTDRFLLHAEHCITFYNERSGNFPGWIEPRWHNCLVGCLHCQSVCPENKDFLDWIDEKGEFSEEETTLLLQAKKSPRFPSSLLIKLMQLELVDYADFLPRNLRVLFNKEEHS